MAVYESDGSVGEDELDEITTAAEVIQKLEEVSHLFSIFKNTKFILIVLITTFNFWNISNNYQSVFKWNLLDKLIFFVSLSNTVQRFL